MLVEPFYKLIRHETNRIVENISPYCRQASLCFRGQILNEKRFFATSFYGSTSVAYRELDTIRLLLYIYYNA